MSRRRPGADPSAIQLWKRTALFVVVGVVLALLLAWNGWWQVAIVFAVVSLFMAWWVSPSRKGLHTPWAEAARTRGEGHAIIVWSTVDRASAQIQVGLRPNDSRLTWVNYMHDAEARAFAKQHGGFDALPLAVVGDRVLPTATSGQVLDALDGR